MGNGLVLLAYGTSRDEIRHKDREAWPPEVTFKDGLGAKASGVTREGRVMDGMEKGRTSC